MGSISDLFEADLEAVWRLFPIFASRWATGECEGSKWGRIKLEIQWAWSQTCDMCPSHVNTCSFLTLLLDELLGSVRGQESMDMVPDTLHVSVTTLLLDELQWDHKYNAHGPRHVSLDLHVSPIWFNLWYCIMCILCSIFLKISNLGSRGHARMCLTLNQLRNPPPI